MIQMELDGAVAVNDIDVTVATKAKGIVVDGGWIVIDPYTTECEVRKVDGISGNDLQFDDGLDYAHADADTVYWVTKAELSVKWFGARGDGSTDDTVAFQRALAQVNALEGALYIPASDYHIYDTLEPASRVKIYGDGRGSQITQKSDDKDTIKTADDGEHIIIRDLYFYGPEGAKSEAVGFGIYIKNADRCIVADCWFNHFRADAIYLGPNSAGANLIEGNYIQNCLRQGISIAGGYNNRIVNNKIKLCTHGIDLESEGGALYNNVVANNVCHENLDNGISVAGGANPNEYGNIVIGNECYDNGHYGIGCSVRTTVIQGNYCHDNGYGGLYLYGDEITASGNILEDNQHGIYMPSGREGSVISGNVAVRNNRKGIYVQGNRHVVSGNNVYGNDTSQLDHSGIELDNADDCIVQSNYVEGADQKNGILISSVCDRTLLTNNVCKGNGTSDIKDNSSTTRHFNNVNGSQLAGLDVATAAAATTPGSVQNKIELFDDTGASLGWVALYDAIT